ncbi:MAG: GIY-YIG nuclease family protein [Gemmatimonadales bacterium]
MYLLASRARTLYVGVTSNLARRVYQHRHKLLAGFTAKYCITRLVYFESTRDARTAITREKQVKGWSRAKKVELIESLNPEWKDLAAGWFELAKMRDSSLS